MSIVTNCGASPLTYRPPRMPLLPYDYCVSTTFRWCCRRRRHLLDFVVGPTSLSHVPQVFIKGKNNEEAVRTLKSGDAFGELALMYNSPRTATVKVLILSHSNLEDGTASRLVGRRRVRSGRFTFK